MITAACMFVVLLAVPTHEQEPPNSTLISPCPDLFTYEASGSEPGRWYGVVNLTTDVTLHSLWLNIVLDNKADSLNNWLGEVITRDNKDYRIENTKIQINPGYAMVVRFFVQYDLLKQTPRVVSIKLNGREICNTALQEQTIIKESRRPMSDFDEDKDVYGPDEREFFAGLSKLTIINLYNKVNTHKNAVDQKQCGTLKKESQWPWQVALYRTKTIDINYICGGTLVSHRHIITTAQCVTRKGTRRPINKNVLTVYLGKHNLKTSAEEVQIRFVENIIIHAEYNGTSFRHDVAILVLRQPVTYSHWVRAACLWPENEKDLKYVTGKKGLLLDWGLDKEGVVVQELSPVEMSVVSQESCISSHHELFETRVSNFTYCAINEKGSSFYPRSSGGGMVFKMDNIWHLRGLVSMFFRKMDEVRCVPTHYFLFTDLAKYLAWIRLNLYDY